MPTGNAFEVTTENLDEAAKFIQDKTAQYHTDVEKLYSEAESLTTDKWKGIASETFHSQLESYRDDFAQLKTILDTFAENLSNKAGNYSTADANVANTVRSI